MRFGAVIKIIIEFKSPFWKTEKLNNESLENLGWLFSDQPIPTWWTQHAEENNILTGWLGGTPVTKYKNASDDELLSEGLKSLSAIFNIPFETFARKLACL